MRMELAGKSMQAAIWPVPTRLAMLPSPSIPDPEVAAGQVDAPPDPGSKVMAALLAALVLARLPLALTCQPTPFASACQGISVDPDAVVKCAMMPVPVLLPVSVSLKRSEVPVAASKVKVEV